MRKPLAFILMNLFHFESTSRSTSYSLPTQSAIAFFVPTHPALRPANILAFGSEFCCALPDAETKRGGSLVPRSALPAEVSLAVVGWRTVLQRLYGSQYFCHRGGVGVGRARPRRCFSWFCLSCPAGRLVSFAAASTAPWRARAELSGAAQWGPNSPLRMGSGGPLSPSRLPCSLWSHPATARGALGERCRPTGGVFLGWRIPTIMAVVTVVLCLLQQLGLCWGRVLFILLCRCLA